MTCGWSRATGWRVPAITATRFAKMLRALAKSQARIWLASDPLKTNLAGPTAALRGWDYRWASNSIPTSLAAF